MSQFPFSGSLLSSHTNRDSPYAKEPEKSFGLPNPQGTWEAKLAPLTHHTYAATCSLSPVPGATPCMAVLSSLQL